MTLLPMTTPIRRALSLQEMTTIIGRVDAAEATEQLLPIVVRGLYDTLLADLGLSLDSLPKGQQLDPRKFLIPARQWEAITGTVTDRAATWGTGAELTMDLINVLPGTYDDPGAPLPDLPRTDHRPDHLEVHASRDAVEVIAAAGHHVQALAAHYGPGSAEHLTAATSWLACLSQLLTISLGPNIRVVRDGNLSMLIHTSSGYTFAVIFHSDARRCTAGDGCTALIADDGTAHAPVSTAVQADHEHRPSFGLDAPRPGSWSLHS
ncbi:MAG: hypothetical protein QOC94_4018 [Actinoplanes sp.]|jgi:hypothetical protein|nr:hypothetical protein [Actinoplanes sp.]